MPTTDYQKGDTCADCTAESWRCGHGAGDGRQASKCPEFVRHGAQPRTEEEATMRVPDRSSAYPNASWKQQQKHTPGPWKWYEGDEPTHAELYPSDYEGEAVDSIAYHGANWRMKDADKALIAAAPDMYDALSDAAAWLSCLDDLTENEQATLDSIAAALAKAEGR